LEILKFGSADDETQALREVEDQRVATPGNQVDNHTKFVRLLRETTVDGGAGADTELTEGIDETTNQTA